MTDISLRRAIHAALGAGGCHGIATRDGEQDACGKPITSIIDGRGTEDEAYWPACTYHAHRHGYDRVVPLATILREAAT